MLAVPRHRAIEDVGDVVRFAHAVAFARVAQHQRFDADVPQRDEGLLDLGGLTRRSLSPCESITGVFTR